MSLNHRVAAIAVLPAVMCALTACGSISTPAEVAEAADTTTTSTSLPEETSPVSLADIVVDASIAPAGFDYVPPAQEGEPSLAEILGADDPESGSPFDTDTFTPPQCAGVHMDSLTVLDWMMEPPETTATASYANPANDDEAIFVKLTSNPTNPQAIPGDISECTEISREMAGDGEQGTLHYAASPADFSINDAHVEASAHVVLTGASVSGIPIESEGIGQGFHLVTATIDDLTFSVAAADTLPIDMVSTIANEQAARITAARS